jgi:preprotein translocase subunit SecF
MRFFGKTSIDFSAKRRMAFLISGLVILAGIISLIIHGGPKYGIDFKGGLVTELNLIPADKSLPELDAQELRDGFAKDGIKNLEIQNITENGKKYFIIKAEKSKDLAEKIVASVKKQFPKYVNKNMIRRQDSVGPKIGKELRGKAVLAIFYSLLGIIIYIWWRFEFTFGIAAVVALFHDVMITIGLFSIFGKEINLTIVAALLTIVGYSLNDTIVVFDRIREDLRFYRKETYESIINFSINETLSRTIITSLTTFIVVFVLFLFGGSVIHDFAFALMVGVIVGTYSSIFIASPILIEYFLRKGDKKRVRKL